MGCWIPSDRANAVIQDLSLAPRNAQGLVEYSTAVEILKPHDMARGNRILMFEVNNRGNKLALGAFNDGVTGDGVARNSLASPGDGWLMRQGYTLIWFGWEMDAFPKLGHLGLTPIVARNADGSPVTGVVRSEMITAAPTPSLPLSASQQVQYYPPDTYDAYPTAHLDNAASQPDGFVPSLTVRAREQDPRETDPQFRLELCDLRGGQAGQGGREKPLLPKGLPARTAL